MGLRIVLDEEEVAVPTKVGYERGEGTAPVEVNNHDGPGARRDGLTYERVINLERVNARLDKDRHKPVLGDGEIGRAHV